MTTVDFFLVTLRSFDVDDHRTEHNSHVSCHRALLACSVYLSEPRNSVETWLGYMYPDVFFFSKNIICNHWRSGLKVATKPFSMSDLVNITRLNTP